jgi:hypothetical protein
MADPTRYPDTGSGSDYEPATGASRWLRVPRWLKVALITLVALVLLFVALQLTGAGPGGEHRPGPPPGGH